MVQRVVGYIKEQLARRSSEGILNYYRGKGIKIGSKCFVRHPRTLEIDVSRPSLVSIGDNVLLHQGLKILTHDYASRIFLSLYHDFVPSHGKVTIGSNVWFGQNCTVLKGVTIGDNCIIGLGSVVTKSIPANSVAVGIPAKVVCTVDEYYQKRKVQYIEEAIAYARSIKERFNREPVIADFKDDFSCFVDGSNYQQYPMLPIKERLKSHYDNWLKTHKAKFNGFEEFMTAVKQESKR